MHLETFDSEGLTITTKEVNDKKTILRNGFESSLKPEGNAFAETPEYVQRNVLHWLEIEGEGAKISVFKINGNVLSTINQMYSGGDTEDGTHTLGLKDINAWKIHEDYKDQNIKQHAGYAAEVIGTVKENVDAILNGRDIRTYRADDRPDLFSKNDQYVDKIRVDENGEVVEKIQVKFVGKDAESCLRKLDRKSVV